MIDSLVRDMKIATIKQLVEDGPSLDVGCGDMTYTKILPGAIGIDKYPEFEGTINQPDFIMSAEDLDFDDNRFVNVCFFDTLEHIDDLQKALSEAHRVLNPSGILAIIDPNDSVLFWARLLALRFKDAFQGNPDHKHVFNTKSLKSILGDKFVLEKKVQRFIFTGYRFRRRSC